LWCAVMRRVRAGPARCAPARESCLSKPPPLGLVLFALWRIGVVAGSDRVFAANRAVNAVRDPLAAACIAQDLGSALVGLALRVESGARPFGSWRDHTASTKRGPWGRWS
jgi:hypothetical protein